MTAEEFKQEASQIQPQLIATAKRYLPHQEDAEDIMQDVLAKLWGMCGELHSPMVALARVLTRNFCIDHIRRQPNIIDMESMGKGKLDTLTAPPTAPPQANEMIERMMTCIEHLPPKQQLVLRLRHMEGMSTTDIAHLMDMSEAAIRQTLCRARQGVREHFLKKRTSNARIQIRQYNERIQ